jgi:tRNA nucleotidyltransferase (CCA-adding enzyme)
MGLEEDILERIRPTEKEVSELWETAGEIKGKVETYLEENGIAAEVRFVGSVAKGTFLSDPDLDIFIMFPPSVSRDELERLGLRAGADILGGKRMYAEHPYTRGVFKDLDVDIVPCYSLKDTDKLLTAVDRTPFHTEYVRSSLSDAQKDDVLLLKKFMKGIGAYGAEPNTRGFSGYLCELLVINYGSFTGVMKAGSEWKEGITISVGGRKGPPMTGPMIVYDPVDPKRNVASAVYIDTLALFIAACKAYASEPSEKFFFPAVRIPMKGRGLRERSRMHGSRILTVAFNRPDVNTDNLYSQIWKTQYALEKKLNTYSFNVLRAVHDLGDDDIVILYELERDVLSKTFKHVGPPVWVRSSESFLSKWSGNEHGEPFIEEGQWNVIAERRHSTAAEMLMEEAVMAGIGREIEIETMRITEHERSLRKTDPLLLTELLDPKNPWDV